MKRIISLLLTLVLVVSCTPGFAQDIVMDLTLDTEVVRRLQIDLISSGYMNSENKVDGIVGEATRAAIRAAQEALNMEVNGLYSDELAQALRPNVFPLSEGMRSSVIYDAQRRLYRWGFLAAEPTGYYGSATTQAVIDFQTNAIDQFVAERQAEVNEAYANMDVPDDVVVDLPIISSETVPCDGVLTREWYDYLFEYEVPTIRVSRGDNGSAVKMMQMRLHSLGYMYTSMNGKFGEVTELALKYFQYRNGLPETGSCDEATSDALFSENPATSDEYVFPYMAYVRRSESRVYVYGWDGRGYNIEEQSFKCSCGARSTPTIDGSFYAVGPISEWYYMKSSNVWVRYAVQIQGNYFFHSVLFNHKGDKRPTSSSVASLGKNVSHGCIRLSVEDCKWLYEHSVPGMKVVIE